MPRWPEKEAKKTEKAIESLESFAKDSMKLDPVAKQAEKKEETEPQTKLSSNEIAKSKDIYLKPIRSLQGVNPKTGVADKFNEKFRADYEFAKEYVQFIAEHKEIVGETIDIWTRPYGGIAAEYWQVPTNKPVWGPRYLAEQIKRKNYHRLKMEQNVITSADHVGQMYGALSVDTLVQRLDAQPVVQKKSIFMGKNF